MGVEQYMYEDVRRLLRKRYPARNGWSILPQYRGSGYRPDFVIVRKKGTYIEKVVVEVKAECYINMHHLKQLNSYAKNIAGRNVRVVSKILVIPAGAIISAPASGAIIRSGIDVIRLRSHVC